MKGSILYYASLNTTDCNHLSEPNYNLREKQMAASLPSREIDWTAHEGLTRLRLAVPQIFSRRAQTMILALHRKAATLSHDRQRYRTPNVQESAPFHRRDGGSMA